jgi:taurine dioxygenase
MAVVATAIEPFGVDVDGVDISRPADAQVRKQLRSLLRRHGLLVLRGQQASLAEQTRFMSMFGPVQPPASERPGSKDYVSKDPKYGAHQGDTWLPWHADLGYCPVPEMANSLLAIDVSDGETSTRFASGFRALAMLPAATRSRIEDLKVEHRYPFTPLTPDMPARQFGTPWEPPHPDQPATVHPVIFPSRFSGEPSLFVTHWHTHYIQGIPVEESDALLAELFDALYAPSNVYEHWWHNGDLVIWDNVALQHSRRDQSKVPRRTLQRVMILEKTQLEQLPEFVHVYGKGPFQHKPVVQAGM